MKQIQTGIWIALMFTAITLCETSLAQAESNTTTEIKLGDLEARFRDLQPTEIPSDPKSAVHVFTPIPSFVDFGPKYAHFHSKYGFVYKTIGLPLIGEHYPFHQAIPDNIRVPKQHGPGPHESVDSVIIQKHVTENAGFETLHGISSQTQKLIWIGLAVLFGLVAAMSKNIIAAFIGANHPALKYLFWIGFALGFFFGGYKIDDITDSLFGKNRLVYFDNANRKPYQVVVEDRDALTIGAKSNLGVYLGLGWNSLRVQPSASSDSAWQGRILVEESDGYLVFNIGHKNEYKVVTGVWKK